MSTYCGIDYSITCPSIYIHNTDILKKYQKGYAFPNNLPKKFWNQYPDGIARFTNPDISIISQKEDWENNESRFFSLAKSVISKIIEAHVDEVAIEDYALGAKGKVFAIAEATGVLKSLLVNIHHIPVYTYAPTTIKKFWSGKGNASKEVMIECFKYKHGWEPSEILGLKYGGNPVSDLVDSYSVLATHLNTKHNIIL